MERPRLVVRADGGAGIGFGHLARCLAVADAWTRAGGEAELMSDRVPVAWQERYAAAGVGVAAVRPWHAINTDWVAIDGYGFTFEDHRRAGTAGRVLVIDDHGAAGAYDAEVIVDPNLGADRVDYERLAPGSSYLLGPRYALIGEAFRSNRAPGREPAAVLLLAFGGDPPESVGRLASAVAQWAPSAALMPTALVDVADVAAVMAGADLALSAAGTTVWELALVGVPMVLVAVAANQEPVGARLSARGAAIYLGPHTGLEADHVIDVVAQLAADPDRRHRLCTEAARLVDGFGARRVVSALRARMLDLRPATAADAPLLWDWVNDPATRAAAFTSAPIGWDEHRDWFGARLASPDTVHYLAEIGGRPIGQIRFDRCGGLAEISLSVAAGHRGQGWAGALIAAGTTTYGTDQPLVEVQARVKIDNVASQRAFVAADFDQHGRESAGDQHWYRYAAHHDRQP
jgi:UDP-2,4-diacetamido-2,4,6-trideoxy-beta-L-altropyranose hydrolase